MKGILKSTGEEVDIYRIWKGKFQNSDKTQLWDFDEIELINSDDKHYLANPEEFAKDSGYFVSRDNAGYVVLHGEKPVYSPAGDRMMSDEEIYLGYGPEVFPDLKENEVKRVRMYLEIVD